MSVKMPDPYLICALVPVRSHKGLSMGVTVTV